MAALEQLAALRAVVENEAAAQEALAAEIANMEIPDSEPVGWIIDLPLGIMGELVDGEVVLSDDVKEWMEINIRDRYWIFNRFADSFTYRSGRARLPVEFNFTSERDFIAFKMRWG